MVNTTTTKTKYLHIHFHILKEKLEKTKTTKINENANTLRETQQNRQTDRPTVCHLELKQRQYIVVFCPVVVVFF